MDAIAGLQDQVLMHTHPIVLAALVDECIASARRTRIVEYRISSSTDTVTHKMHAALAGMLGPSP